MTPDVRGPLPEYLACKIVRDTYEQRDLAGRVVFRRYEYRVWRGWRVVR